MATTELLGGQIDLTVGNILNSIPHIKTGKLKAIGTTGSKRTPALPNVPTVAESGVPGYEVILWWGMFAPAGVPQPILAKLEKEMVAIPGQPALKDKWASDGTVIAPSTSQQLDALLKAEHKKWGDVVQRAKIKPE